MEDKDFLKDMFMDMSDAQSWASQAYQRGFVQSDGKFIPDDPLNIWADTDIKYKTIWEFTKQNPGKDLGRIIFNASLEQGVKSIKKAQSGSDIPYRAYPVAWLEMWFRDYDAKLSMEVYNKSKAKEALNKINKL